MAAMRYFVPFTGCSYAVKKLMAPKSYIKLFSLLKDNLIFFFLRFKAQTCNQLRGNPCVHNNVHTDLPLRRIRQRETAHKNRFWSDRLRYGAIVCDEVRQNRSYGVSAYVFIS